MKIKINAKDKLLNNTHKLFADNGIDKVTVRDIGAYAGVNPASVFYHFGGKEGLVLAIIEKFISDKLYAINSGLRFNIVSTSIAETVLKSFIHELFKIYNQNHEVSIILINAADCSDETLRESVSRHLYVIFKELVTFFDNLKQQNIVHIKNNSSVHAYLVLSPLLQLARNERNMNSFFPLSVNNPVFIDSLCEEIVRKAFI